MADVVYNAYCANAFKADVDWENDAIKVALLANTYTPNKDDSTWSDVSAHEISGTGYTSGGATLSNVSVTQDDANDLAYVDADDVSWENATFDCRYAVLYDDSHASDALICVFDFGADKSVENGTFAVRWNANGIVKLQQGT